MSDNKVLGTIMQVAFLVAAVLYSFSQLFYGLDLTDSFYYLSLFKSGELSASVPGFQFIGHLWLMLFPETIISVRVANWLFYAASFVLAYIWFVPEEEGRRPIVLLALPFIALPTFSLNIFNGDSCTLLIVVCLCRALSYYIESPTLWRGIALGLLLYVGALLRFPNIVAVALGIVPVLLFSKKKSCWLGYLLISCAVVSLYMATQFLIAHFGGVSLASDLSDADGSHSLMHLIEGYWKDARAALSFFPVCVVSLLLCFEHRLGKIRSLLFSVAAFLYFVYWLRCEVYVDFACWNLSVFVSSFVAAICILSIYFSIVSGRRWFLPLVILVMSFVNPAGSDTGLLKLVLVPVAFVPAILTYIKYDVKKPVLLYMILGCLIVYCLYGHYKCPFGEPSLPQLTCRIDAAKTRGIRTGAAQYGLYESAKRDVDSLGKDNVVLYGTLAHGLNELLEIETEVGTTFFMDAANDGDVESMKACIRSNHPSILFMPYKPDGAKIIFANRTELTEMEKMFLSQGYQVSKMTDYYYIYSPISEQQSITDDSDRI